MKLTLNSVKDAVKNMFDASRRVDYKTLSKYILKINQKNDLGDILEEASLCLKEILDYRMFAFGIHVGDELCIWIDPEMYKDSVENMIDRDFNIGRSGQVIRKRFINVQENSGHKQVSIESSELMFFNMCDENYNARLYLSPEKRVKPYHSDIINIIIKTVGTSLSRFMDLEKLRSDVALDPLTGSYNRREFERQIETHIANADRYGKDLSIIMFDIDHFKRVNDTYGHQAGDEVLKMVARVISDEIRKGDILARYGGEEFVAILPETSKKEAVELAERLRVKVRNMSISAQMENIKITSSFGVASMAPSKNRDSLIGEADSMLYKAKTRGRDMVMPGVFRVCVSGARA